MFRKIARMSQRISDIRLLKLQRKTTLMVFFFQIRRGFLEGIFEKYYIKAFKPNFSYLSSEDCTKRT